MEIDCIFESKKNEKKEEKQGRIHDGISRVLLGRGSAARPENAEKSKCVTYRQTNGPT